MSSPSWWPSKTVPQGGILHLPKPSCSSKTQHFLKELINESKMTMMQRNKTNYHLRDGVQSDRPKYQRCSSTAAICTIRPGSSKRRPRDAILRSGVYERDMFVPQRITVDRDKEKARLQNNMAYGADTEPPSAVTIRRRDGEVAKTNNKQQNNRFDQLVQEIEDRNVWLREMNELGEGDKHKLVMQQQIEARVREMSKLKMAE